MKKITFLLLCISCSSLISLAQKCPYEKNDTDPFTGEEIKITKKRDFLFTTEDQLSAVFHLESKCKNDQCEQYLVLTYRSTRVFNVSFNEDHKLLLKFDSPDNTIVELTGEHNVSAMQEEKNFLGTFQTLTNKYSITQELLKLFRDYPITFARVYYTNNNNNELEYWDYNSVFHRWISNFAECYID